MKSFETTPSLMFQSEHVTILFIFLGIYPTFCGIYTVDSSCLVIYI